MSQPVLIDTRDCDRSLSSSALTKCSFFHPNVCFIMDRFNPVWKLNPIQTAKNVPDPSPTSSIYTMRVLEAARNFKYEMIIAF